MTGEKTSRLLRRVAARQRLVSLSRRLHRLFLVLAGAYLLGLCAGRLLGLAPHVFTPVTLLVVPAAALLVAALLTRPPRAVETARLVDERMKTHDLYLTAVMIDHSIGEFKPLVLETAEARAETIQPAQVAPFRWQRGARDVAVAAALLLLGVQFLPTFDPFGKEQARRKVAERQKQLEESRQATALRAELLKKEQPNAALSKEVDQKLAELQKTLQEAKPTEQKANLAALQQEQKEMAGLWRKTSERKLKDAIERTPPAQQFGGLNPKANEWKQQLQMGNPAGLNKELEELQKTAEQIVQMPDGVEKDKAREQMKDRLRDLADFMAREANHLPAQAAMQRALDQLAMAGAKGMDKEALKALQESLKLTEMELNALAQNLRDLNALEEGLKVAQLAKRLNDKGKLGEGQDGMPGGQEAGMEGYARLYAKMLAEGLVGENEGEGGNGPDGEGNGGGMGGRGRGRGGVAPEDPDAQTDFKSEQSKSALVAGKLLLQWKTHELSDKGEARENFLQRVADVKQGASEAILKEQVPPGYHDAITKYFDTMGESSAKPSNP